MNEVGCRCYCQVHPDVSCPISAYDPISPGRTPERMEDRERRFTEHELDAILRHAVELERAGLPQRGLAQSLSLSELRDVAQEAGIRPELIESAAADLALHGPRKSPGWLGPPAVSRSVRLLSRHLSDADIELLLRLVENRLRRKGIVSEALGRVNWVSTSAQVTTDISISQQDGPTRIDVADRYPEHIRPLLHLLPGAMGLTLAASVAAPLGVFGVPLVALAVGGGVLGAAVGRGIWELAARDTARRADRLATELASAAEDLGSKEASSGYDTTS